MGRKRTFWMFDWSKRLTALQGWPLICYDPLSYFRNVLYWCGV
jgi:hypothetical protein